MKKVTMINEDYIRAWRIGNDAGKGSAVGDDDMTCEEAAESEGYSDLEIDEAGRVLCSDGDDAVVIADSNGPWAVRIPTKNSD